MPAEMSQQPDRLSVIITRWTLLQQAHGEGQDPARRAQEQLLVRYGGAIRRYLLGCVRDADQADELYQEFAVKFIQGSLRGADPAKGRFRHYLKGVLFHLLADHHQRRKKQPAGWNSQLPEPAESLAGTTEADAAFQEQWRAELLADTWTQLEQEEKQSGQPWFTILAYRRDHPDERSEAMADGLGKQLGKQLTAASVRQSLHRARERFADLLLDLVLHSLQTHSTELLHQELIDLNLYQYCEPAIARLEQGKQSDGS